MPGKIICIYNVKASIKNNELKLDTTDQTQIEFPTEFPDFRHGNLTSTL